MRLLFRHAIAVIVLLFVAKLAFEAPEQSRSNDLPKSVILSRMASGDPIPSRALTPQAKERRVLEGLVNGENSSNNR